MTTAASIPTERCTGGDGYTIVHIAEDHTYDADETWAAQARLRKEADEAEDFDVTARAGTLADDTTGLDETGNTVVIASLTGTQTRTFIGNAVFCDLELRPDGYPTSADPATFLEWRLSVTRDVTR